ncbi:MAG: PadR family transcriptional regulator [Candidatus Hodarchaeales archaeon]
MNSGANIEISHWLKLWNRDMNRGLLQLLVLAIIVDNDEKNLPPCSKTIIEISKDTIRVAAGTIYPLLHRLRDKGLIREMQSSDYDRNRRNPTLYTATATGKRFLDKMFNRWDEFDLMVKYLKYEIDGERLSGDKGL